MNTNTGNKRWVNKAAVVLVALGGLALGGCNTGMVRSGGAVSGADCSLTGSTHLADAMVQARGLLDSGCRNRFSPMFDQLLTIGAGDPKPENKQLFSEFLVWAGERGLISPLQAKETYTRYFGAKFVSALGEYNLCAQTCPIKGRVLADMRTELGDKARGLMQVSQDREGYAQANRLFQETELVITATCEACAPTGLARY